MSRLVVDRALVAQVWRHLRARDERPHPTIEGRPRLQIKAHDDAATDVLIYDEIGFWGIMATDVAEQLAGITGDLNVRINSPGGDVFDGFAIYNMLVDHDGAVNVTVDGVAASAASFIAQAGDTIRMNRASQMMIHDASGLCIGNAADMTEMSSMLDRVSDAIAGIYADRAGGTVADWRTAMRAETWYSAAEAVEAGLAGEMAPARGGKDEPPADEGATAKFDLTCYQYAGRRYAPPPAMPTATTDLPADKTPEDKTPEGQQTEDRLDGWDPDEFMRAIKEGVGSNG